MAQELVSVIMPTHNEGKFLSASVESVLAQTYQNLELLITDDCSDDKLTLDILAHYAAADSRVRVMRLDSNQGAGPARNNSIRAAKGRYIAFCDGDDRWLPDKLEKQVAFMQKEHCRLTYASYLICDEDDRKKGIFIAPDRVTYGGMLRDDKIGFSTAMYDVQAVGGKFYMPSLKRRQDWAMLISLLQRCRVAYGLKEPLTIYRIRKGSISRNKLQLVKYNTRVFQEVLGWSRLRSYLFFSFVFMPTHLLKFIKKKADSTLYVMRKKC